MTHEVWNCSIPNACSNIGSCKSQKKAADSPDNLEKTAPPGPSELYPDQAILNIEIAKELETSVLANFVSSEKQGFGSIDYKM